MGRVVTNVVRTCGQTHLLVHVFDFMSNKKNEFKGLLKSLEITGIALS